MAGRSSVSRVYQAIRPAFMAAKKGNPFTLQQFGTESRPLRRPINDRNRSRHVVVQRNPLTAAG
ncbi:hypothetical protein IE4771_PE00674 (plasmid) [Rhizobium etli bv. mimosae str. IE4771]|uniref:Uncharacterized protein n=1 Tax=Rhizobium etli bv. mimosae str. IE4771 TaxID=1432050 RepID=A0A060IDT5_RHIET|nr:hypothetical protein IE4771_PE00674 [Rhizobium sp. IE4771]ARQ62627.1 hypothetical protein Kim5_PD00623 [Rhizobium sp. Kim5]